MTARRLLALGVTIAAVATCYVRYGIALFGWFAIGLVLVLTIDCACARRPTRLSA